MARPSLSRRLLRRLSFGDLRLINKECGLAGRNSKEQLVEQLVRHYGRDLSCLVSSDGPYSLSRWNEFAEELGGSARKSYESVAAEIELGLDPVFDDLDGELSLSEIRDDKSAIRLLASKIGVDRTELTEILRKAHGNILLQNFVAHYREERRKKDGETKPETSATRLASTRAFGGESIEPLTLAWMEAQLVGADTLHIAAGFYDVDFIESLLRGKPSITSIRLLLNGLGGRRLEDQQKELIDLRKKLGYLDRSISIRLAFYPGLFHSKLYLMSGPWSKRAFIGSANATTAAFEVNEEILVQINSEYDSLLGYFNAVWEGDEARDIDSVQAGAKSIVAFFRTGVLYFKPIETLGVTHNPFRELLNLLTDDERSKLGSIELPHADDETGVGSFSLRRAANFYLPLPQGMSAVEDLGNEDQFGEDDESETSEGPAEHSGKPGKVKIKSWSIETCYGYWVPSKMADDFDARLKSVGEAKCHRLKDFEQQLTLVGVDELLSRYKQYLDAVKAVLERVVNLEKYHVELARALDEKAFGRLYDRVLGKLRNKNTISRLTEPFVAGPVPEIWEDAQALEEFKNTFLDYLAQVSQRPKRRPFVPGKILERMKIAGPSDRDAIETAFKDFLRKTPWTDSFWK